MLLLAEIRGGSHIFDGKACCLGDIGRSDFERLQAGAPAAALVRSL